MSSGPLNPDATTPGSPVRPVVEDSSREESMSSISTMTNSFVSTTRDRDSAFRRATSHLDQILIESAEERNRRIVMNRGCLKWLPVLCSTDLVHGSWWYVIGSLLSMLIPVFPLISLWQNWWPEAQVGLPRDCHIAAYGLMIWLGFWYTVGSYAFLRAVEYPVPPPLLKNSCFGVHLGTDELFGMYVNTCEYIGVMLYV